MERRESPETHGATTGVFVDTEEDRLVTGDGYRFYGTPVGVLRGAWPYTVADVV